MLTVRDGNSERKHFFTINVEMTDSQVEAIRKESTAQGYLFSHLLQKKVMEYVVDITEAWDGNPYKPSSQFTQE